MRKLTTKYRYMKTGISLYTGETIRTKNTHTYTNVVEVLQSIKDQANNNVTTSMRCKEEFLINGKSDKYKDLKDSLPAIMFNGYFPTGRNLADMKGSSGFMVLDIDGLTKDSFDEALKAFKECEYSYAIFRSPSYYGLKVLFRIPTVENNLEFKEYFSGSEELFKELLGDGFAGFDKSSSNLNRLCYWNYDPDLYVNQDAVIFDRKVKREVAPPILVKKFAADHKEYTAITSLMENKLSKIANNIKEASDGEKHHAINTLCMTMGGYCGAYQFFDSNYVLDVLVHSALSISTKSEKEIEKQVRGAFSKGVSEPLEFPTGEIVNAERPEFFGELFRLIGKGYKKNVLAGRQGNEMRMRFSGEANRYGIPQGAVVNFLIEEIRVNCNEYEVRQDVGNGYEKSKDRANSISLGRLSAKSRDDKKTNEKYQTTSGKFFDWLIKNKAVVNVVDDTLMIGGEKYDNDRLVYHCQGVISEDATSADVKAAKAELRSTDVGTFSPAIEWIKGLPAYDGKDHIKALTDCFMYRYPEFSGFYVEMFKKHLVRSIRMIDNNEESNRYIVVLTSIKHGIGKTRLFSWMTNNQSTSEIKLNGDNDTLTTAMAEKVCCYFDEMEGFNFKNQKEIKSLISAAKFTRRVMYSQRNIEPPRTATLFGCTNEEEFLTDSENARYLTFSLIDIAWRTYVKTVDPLQLWAQAKALYESGETGGLTEAEQETQYLINKTMHQKGTVSESILDGVVREIETEDNECNYIKFADLVSVVNNMHAGTSVKDAYIRAALSNMGINGTELKATKAGRPIRMVKLKVLDLPAFRRAAFDRDGNRIAQLYACNTNRGAAVPLFGTTTYEGVKP